MMLKFMLYLRLILLIREKQESINWLLLVLCLILLRIKKMSSLMSGIWIEILEKNLCLISGISKIFSKMITLMNISVIRVVWLLLVVMRLWIGLSWTNHWILVCNKKHWLILSIRTIMTSQEDLVTIELFNH